MTNYSFYKLLCELLKKYNKEEIFLRTNKSLKHPNKEVESLNFSQSEKDFLVQIMVNFMGLQGSTSQLPNYMLDKLSRKEEGDMGWTLFFDFFNHHILWLFYEIVGIKTYSKSFKADFDDTISKILFAILGINDKEVAKKYLPFAPLLLSLRRPKHHIEKVLQSNFNLKGKLSIIEYIPHQITISKKQQNELGRKNHILGKNVLLGKTFLSHQSKIAIYIQDIDYAQALEYLPNEAKFKELKESIIFLTNDEFCVDLYLKVNISPRMHFTLGDKAQAKLGWGLILGKPKNNHYSIHAKLYE